MSDTKIQRLRELSDAVSLNERGEFSMRVPAEPDRDADLVLWWAADEIERLRAELALVEKLMKEGNPILIWHPGTCGINPRLGDDGAIIRGDICTCGRDALLKAMEAP